MVAGEVATVTTLREDNRLLSLKLKYLQSVTTIYRQKITSVTRQALQHLSDQIDVDARVTHAIDAAEMDTEAALRQFDDTIQQGGGCYPTSPSRMVTGINNTKALLYGSPPSSPRGGAAAAASLKTPEEEASFWRAQFLSVVGEMRPVSLHDAQVLCNALADKRQLQDEINRLKYNTEDSEQGRRSGGGGEGEDAGTLVESSLQNQATINMVLVSPLGQGSPQRGGERFADGVTIKDSTFSAATYPNTTPSSFNALQARLKEETDKNKALRVRINALSSQIGENEADLRGHISTLRTENVRILRGMRDVEGDRQRLVNDNHELSQQVLLHEKTIALKESQIFRMDGRTKALERELQSASNRMDSLFEQEHERRAAETAALQKAFDDNRALQNEIQLLKANLQSAQRQQEDSDIEYEKVTTAVKTLKNIQTQLRQTIDVAHSDKHAAALEKDSLQALLPRMTTAQDELDQFFTFREVSSRCGHLNKQMDDLQSVCKSMLELNKIIEMRHKEIRLLRGECERSTSIGLPPSIAQNVDAVLVDPDYTPVPELKPRKHVVLRQEGTWLELRDTGTGRTTYITSAVAETPFCPVKIKAAEEGKGKASPASPVSNLPGKKRPIGGGPPKASPPPPAVAAVTSPTSSNTAAEGTDDGSSPYNANNSGGSPPPLSAPVSSSTPDNAPSTDTVNRERLIRIFNQYNPAKLSTVDLVMERFRGRYDEMFEKLVHKYGPEPDQTTPIPDLPPQQLTAADAPSSSAVSHTETPEVPPPVQHPTATTPLSSQVDDTTVDSNAEPLVDNDDATMVEAAVPLATDVASPLTVADHSIADTITEIPPSSSPPPLVGDPVAVPTTHTTTPVMAPTATTPVPRKASPRGAPPQMSTTLEDNKQQPVASPSPPSSPKQKVPPGKLPIPARGKVPISPAVASPTTPNVDNNPSPSLFGPSSPPANTQRKIPVVKRPVVAPRNLSDSDSRDTSPSMSPPPPRRVLLQPTGKTLSKRPIGPTTGGGTPSPAAGGGAVDPDDI